MEAEEAAATDGSLSWARRREVQAHAKVQKKLQHLQQWKMTIYEEQSAYRERRDLPPRLLLGAVGGGQSGK